MTRDSGKGDSVRLWRLPAELLPDGPERAHRAYFDRIELAAEAVRRFEMDVARRHLEAASADRRGFEWHLLNRQQAREEPQPTEWDGPVDNIGPAALSADGSFAVTASDDGNVHFWNATTGKLIDRKKGKALGNSVAVSANGQFVAWLAGGREVKLLDRTGAEEHSLAESPEIETLFKLALSRDGQKLAVAGRHPNGTGFLRVYYRGAKREPMFLDNFKGAVREIAFTQDGKTLGITSDYELVLINVDTQKRQHHTGFTQGGWRHLTFSRDGCLLAVEGNDQCTVRLHDVITGDQVGELRGHTKDICELAFSPTDTALASVSSDGTVRVWDLASRRSRWTIHLATFDDQFGNAVRWFPDGRRLLTVGRNQKVRVWQSCPRKSPLPSPSSPPRAWP